MAWSDSLLSGIGNVLGGALDFIGGDTFGNLLGLGALGGSLYLGLRSSNEAEDAMERQGDIADLQGALAAEQINMARDAFEYEKELTDEQLSLFREIFAANKELTNEQLEIMRDELAKSTDLTQQQIDLAMEAFLNNKELSEEQQQMMREAFLQNKRLTDEQFALAKDSYQRQVDMTDEDRERFARAFDKQMELIDFGFSQAQRNQWLAQQEQDYDLAQRERVQRQLDLLSGELNAANASMGAFGANRFNPETVEREFQKRLTPLNDLAERTMDRLTSQGVAGYLRQTGGAEVGGQVQELGRALMEQEANLRNQAYSQARNEALQYISGLQGEIYRGEEFDTQQRANRLAEIVSRYQPSIQGTQYLPQVRSAQSVGQLPNVNPQVYNPNAPVMSFPGGLSIGAPGQLSVPQFPSINPAGYMPQGFAGPGFPQFSNAASGSMFQSAGNLLGNASNTYGNVGTTYGNIAGGFGQSFGSLLSDYLKR